MMATSMGEQSNPQKSKVLTRSQAKKTLLDADYLEKPEFESSTLPTRKEIVQNLLYILRPSRVGKAGWSKDDCYRAIAEFLQEHWLYCNLYTVTIWTICKRIKKLYDEFQALLQTRTARQNTEVFLKKAEKFNSERNTIFDIFCEDPVLRQKLESEHLVKMTAEEWAFLEDQRGPRKMICESFVDRKWIKTMQRRKHELELLESQRVCMETDQNPVESISLESNESGTEIIESNTSQEIFYINDQVQTETESQSECENLPKRRKVAAETPLENQYQHVRLSVRKVRPEFYQTVDKLKSVYHMSEKQAEASVVEVANKMFGRNWKLHEEASPAADILDTLPHSSAIRLIGKSIEIQALNVIVEEIMASDATTAVTYMDDGSKKQGAGSFSVQGITINSVYRALPTLPISSEKRQNLADLRLAVLSILEEASGIEAKVLFERIDFVMTDQTAHNFAVENMVAEQLETDDIPDHLFCNVHPSLMFNRIITSTWSLIENAIGRDKIYSSFLVNATSNADSVTTQGLDCMTRLINHDFDSKPWNKANDFDLFIGPDKKNKSVSLKDERFNRLTLTCAVVTYHFDDLKEFLEKYEHVTNQLACIVRCFIELELLRVMFCVGALIGLHLTEPFLSLTTSSQTTYSVLIPAFQQLYEDLMNTDATALLSVDEPAFKFISKERFLSTRYEEVICTSIKETADKYRPHILKILRRILPELAKGFQKQKGNFFEFGDVVPEGDHKLSSMDPAKLENAPINNIASERSVGSVNYGLGVRGSKQLASVSGFHVKSKAYDLLDTCSAGSFRKFVPLVRKGGAITELKLQWTMKQKELKEQGMSEKEVANLAVDRRRMKDLQSLKEMGGPLTSSSQLDKYVKGRSKNKLDRLYLEVRYARDTSLTVPKNSDIFRLMKAYKKLPLATYTANLRIYLDNVSSKTEVSLRDLENVLDNLPPN